MGAVRDPQGPRAVVHRSLEGEAMTDKAVQPGRPAVRRRKAIGPAALVLSLMPYAIFLVLALFIHPT